MSAFLPNRCRVPLALMLLAGASLWGPPHAYALIQKLFSVKEIMDESEVIAEGKIERVDSTEQTAAVRITGSIKGQCAYKEMKLLVAFGEPWHPAILLKRLKSDAPVILFQKSGETFVYKDRKEQDEVHCIGYAGGVWFLASGNRREQLGKVRWALREKQLHSAQTLGAEAPDLGKQLDDFERSGEGIFWIFRHVELYLTRTFRGSTQELIDLVKDIHAGKRQAPPPDPSVPPLSVESSRKEEPGGQREFPGELPRFTSDSGAGRLDGYEAYSLWFVHGWGGPAELDADAFTFRRGRVLRVRYPRAKQDKIAIGRALVADFSGARRLLFEALNTGSTPVKLAWAVKTDVLKQYFEGPPMELAPGSWQYDLETDLTASHFKCAATDWEWRSRLIAPDRVVELTLLICDAPDDGTLTLDRVRLDSGRIFVRAIPLAWGEDLCGVAWADYRADGRLRACVCSPDQTRLFQNRAGEFLDVTFASGLRGGSRSAAWADYTGDGHPDLLTDRPRLFTYTGHGFRDDSNLLLPHVAQPPSAGPAQVGGGAAGWIDYNGDGLPDILVADGECGLRLLENTGKGPE
jgi:hypothetical protein